MSAAAALAIAARFPIFDVTDLDAALEEVRTLGGEIIHPGERWAICRDSDGTPFGLAGPPSRESHADVADYGTTRERDIAAKATAAIPRPEGSP